MADEIADTRRFVDPKIFTYADLPIIVLCDDRRGILSGAIRAHTNGNYNHAFIMHKVGKLVSQGFSGFGEHPIDVYLVPGQMLKFWRIKNLSVNEKLKILEAINVRLALPWWRRTYDFLGTFVGQTLRVKWIQNPFQAFCSEQVNDDYIAKVARAWIMKIKTPSPSELNAVFLRYPELMECLGYWWED